MGRRALRKIDPLLSLSQHLKTLDEMLEPWDPEALFGRIAPLEIEVGSGKGLFLANAAEAQPETNFLGIEVIAKYARFSAAKLARNDIRNAVMVSGDALRLFRESVPDASLQAIHVYFPDPWWKKRHRKRRVMNEAFAADIQRTLVPGGRLHFWSDVQEYFDETLELLERETQLEGPFEVPVRPAEHELDYRTNFERRMRLHDVPVYRSEFRRPESLLPSG